jgi:hypothetical protein
VSHLEAGSSETALHVEALVRLAAVQNGLVAADLLGDEIERLDDAETQLLALLVLGDRNVLDVADETETVDAAGKKEGSAVFESSLLAGTLPSSSSAFQVRGSSYNLRSTIKAPVPTMTGLPLLESSTTNM